MSMQVTNVDHGKVGLWNLVHVDDTFTAPGAGTTAEGTILARNTASGKLVPYEIGGAGGNEIPVAVTSYDIVAAGAGDLPVKPIIQGHVRFDKLIVAADGDNSNITPAIRDRLRSFGIVAIDIDQLNQLDNQ